MSAYVRTARIGSRQLVEELGLDMLLVNHLVNVRYLTGFTGTNGDRGWSARARASS